mmetsp:Transcript_25969/g.44681  ORF Transcript_25969/g.44681 Transcript_25969/m.44681 type:complete len:223 (+) Transcript_25969:57-725(+)
MSLLSSLTSSELKDLLEAAGLCTHGTRAALKHRAEEHLHLTLRYLRRSPRQTREVSNGALSHSSGCPICKTLRWTGMSERYHPSDTAIILSGAEEYNRALWERSSVCACCGRNRDCWKPPVPSHLPPQEEQWLNVKYGLLDFSRYQQSPSTPSCLTVRTAPKTPERHDIPPRTSPKSPHQRHLEVQFPPRPFSECASRTIRENTWMTPQPPPRTRAYSSSQS